MEGFKAVAAGAQRVETAIPDLVDAGVVIQNDDSLSRIEHQLGDEPAGRRCLRQAQRNRCASPGLGSDLQPSAPVLGAGFGVVKTEPGTLWFAVALSLRAQFGR